MSASPSRFAARLRCGECGHEYTLEPATVTKDERGQFSRYFGSAYDFCPKCDGAPKEIPMSTKPRGRSGPALQPIHFPASHPAGPWGVNSIGRIWYVCRLDTLQSKRIGPVGAPRTNYFDAALNEAERRNRKEQQA